MGIGVVVRDFQGLVHAARSQTRNTHPEPVIAEAMGALKAIEFCRELGLQDIILEGDAEIVVRAINDKNSKWCRYGQIL
jgi:ribonuclease HI